MFLFLGSESTEDKNSSSFIKVCSFAKPPESWKETISPVKARKNMHQGLQDLSNPQHHALNLDILDRKENKRLHPASTMCVNSLVANRIDASSKNVLSVESTNKYNELSLGTVQSPKMDSQTKVNFIRYPASNPNITTYKIVPNKH